MVVTVVADLGSLYMFDHIIVVRTFSREEKIFNRVSQFCDDYCENLY